VHLYDAHEPYNPPATFRPRFETRPYDGEIAFMDTLVAALLTRAGADSAASATPPAGRARARRPLVVVAGDHGESLGDHGESTHGLFVYESALRVPLIVSWPGILDQRVIETPVGLADVAPTVAALATLLQFGPVDGRILPLDGGVPSARPIYAETYFPQFFMNWAPLRSVRDARWKLIDAPEPELYDLTADPGETTNRFASEPATARALRRELERLARSADRVSAAPMSADAQRRLASLGYVSSAPAAPAAGTTAPDPKRMVALYEQLLEGNRALATGRNDEAVRIARRALEADRGNAFARLVLGRGLLATGQPRDAIEALRAYLAAVPGSADAHHWIALAHLRLDDRERALAEEEAAIALDPRHTAALSLRAGLMFSAGRKDQGVQSLAAAVAADPMNLSLRAALADLLADAGRAADAEAEYRRVLDARPTDVAARLGLGVLLARTERYEPAIAELTRVLELAPAEDEARFERAVAYLRLGRNDEARAGFERLDAAETRPDIRQAAQRALRDLRR
jgi:choline-sulfatase